MSAQINIYNAFSDYLRQQLDLTDFQISQWERIADGWETDVYAYQLITPQRTEDKILRIFIGDSLPKARREYYGMSALEYLGYCVPRVSHLCEDASILGGPFILMQRIFGQPLGRVMQKDTNLLSRFVALQVELHQLPAVPMHELVPNTAPVTDLAEAWAAKMVWARKLVLDEYKQTWAEPLLDWLDAHKPHYPANTHPATLHNDFHPYNVLMSDDADLLVIDWPNIEIGDARSDLAWTILLMTTYNQPADMRERILEAYAQHSGQRVFDIEIFEVVAATRRIMDLVMMLGAGAEAMGMRPETIATIRQQGGHFRAVYDVMQSRTGLSFPFVENILAQLAG